VALLSALDYSQNTAAASYGGGIELRLVEGEVEFRFSQRYPAYSLRLRSQGAAIGPGEWRHVALVYEGAAIAIRLEWKRRACECLSMEMNYRCGF